MSEHPNVTTVDRMTQAILDQDTAALGAIFTEDMAFHLRGPWRGAGDYAGVDGLLAAFGGLFEDTGGDITLDQQFCVGIDGWAAEWEHCVLGHNGKKLQSNNAFVYRFEGGRIAEMWMFLGADPAAAEAWAA